MFEVNVRLPKVTAKKIAEIRATYPSMEYVDIPIIRDAREAEERAMDYANNVLFAQTREYAHTTLKVEETEDLYIVTLDASEY